MEIDTSNNNLSKSTSITDTSADSQNATEPMKSSENDESLEDGKVSTFFLYIIP